MPERVVATPAAEALIDRLKEQHGLALMFYQSHGCCDGSAPMCYLEGELTPGRYDLLLGKIGGCPFYISESQYQYWKNSQLIIGVTEGSGSTFSLEGPEGVCFTTGSRLWTDAELETLNHPGLDPSPETVPQ
ncbi:MAG: DUF779 domain-containing protein [Comamonadaceae bacterium]|nr:DUF779 domain-containing protein [Comamonadaceae bacterium]